MSIAAHTPGGYGGVPHSVGAEFHNADKQKAKFKYSGTEPGGIDRAKKLGNLLRHA